MVVVMKGSDRTSGSTTVVTTGQHWVLPSVGMIQLDQQMHQGWHLMTVVMDSTIQNKKRHRMQEGEATVPRFSNCSRVGFASVKSVKHYRFLA